MARRFTSCLRAAMAAAFALALGAGMAPAQDTAIRLGGSLQLSGTALEVTAEELSVDQGTGASVFAGNVLAVQGDLRLTAGALRLEYRTGANSGQRIDRLIASGGVTLVTPAEAVEAREAVYDLSQGTLEMTGDVLLVQGPNTLAGERFTADLRSGAGRISGRVRTIIQLD